MAEPEAVRGNEPGLQSNPSHERDLGVLPRDSILR